jgi:hypothetical protein
VVPKSAGLAGLDKAVSTGADDAIALWSGLDLLTCFSDVAPEPEPSGLFPELPGGNLSDASTLLAV